MEDTEVWILKQRAKDVLLEIEDGFAMGERGNCEIDYCFNVMDSCGKIINELLKELETTPAMRG